MRSEKLDVAEKMIGEMTAKVGKPEDCRVVSWIKDDGESDEYTNYMFCTILGEKNMINSFSGLLAE